MADYQLKQNDVSSHTEVWERIGGLTLWWAALSGTGWDYFGNEHSFLVISIALASYITGLWLLWSEDMERVLGDAVGEAVPLAIIGGLAWYLYPGQDLYSKSWARSVFKTSGQSQCSRSGRYRRLVLRSRRRSPPL